jgi:hypothetical protein
VNERRAGDVLASFGPTNRKRRTIGTCGDLTGHERIHEMVRDYEGDVIPTDPLQACEICTKKEHHVSDKPSSVKAAD